MTIRGFIIATCKEVVDGAQSTGRADLNEPISIEFDLPIVDPVQPCRVKFTIKIHPGKVKGDD